MKARENPPSLDLRWQRAMERLGLCVPYEDCIARIPDPDDPTTFLRVVEAVRTRIGGFQWDLLWTHMYGAQRWPTDFYEAVMEAFGKE